MVTYINIEYLCIFLKHRILMYIVILFFEHHVCNHTNMILERRGSNKGNEEFEGYSNRRENVGNVVRENYESERVNTLYHFNCLVRINFLMID